MGVRKSATRLTPTERDNFLEAVLTLKGTIANPAAPAASQISVYDQYVALHLCVWNVNAPGEAFPIDMGHGNSGFGPWHREYLLRFEQALQAINPAVTLPYWDWTDHAGTQNILFQDSFMGPNGGPGGVGGGTVQSGYFAFDKPGAGGNPTPLPAWWPAALPGWRVRPSMAEGLGTTLRRTLQPFGNLATQAHVSTPLVKPDYENVMPASGMRPALEGGPRMHNSVHLWVGGHMGGAASPNDLIFFLHHCNVDRLWAMWQIDGHLGPASYPAAGRPEGHNLADPMWPWVGGLAGYSSNNLPPDVVLPDFTAEPVRHPSDVLDHRSLGYAYDTEPIVGVALDQTGSMVGLTPDPMTGMAPNVSKWEAAKQGVSFFLHDCEAAYTAREAYVTAGVETFRSLPANTFTQIFVGTPYGVVKGGGSYSQATFDANIAAQTPGGGTPLAAALTDTDTSLVRAPFGDQPPGEQRYLAILTDGKETAAPLLSTLAEPEFPDTVVLAMGFGVGGGWDGVDYATIADLTEKGKAATAIPSLVFHGENAAVIDKFFTNSVAAAIGYTPAVDPVFDLFPGEHVHVPFDATDADQSFMITALGFDLTDSSWDYCLMAPDGSHCADTRVGVRPHGGNGHLGISPFLVTTRRRNGRCTIFLNRNGADSSHWVGRWVLMVFYKADPDEPIMVLPTVSDLILPVGSPPLRGPLYARLGLAPERRPSVRIIPGTPPHRLAVGLPGLSRIAEGPSALSVNIFGKTAIETGLTIDVKAPFAGHDFDVVLALDALGPGRVDRVVTAARLVAPDHSLGNAFADLKTISPKTRRKYLVRGNPRAPFDEVRYLADYERKRRGAFAMRDEEVVFEAGHDGALRARVGGNRFPGVYRVSVYVEGVYEPPPPEQPERADSHGRRGSAGAPQRFSRVLTREVALGILPDARMSKPTLQWVAPDRFVVTVTPTDKLGNVAAPANAPAPAVTLGGESIEGHHDNPFTGEQRLEIELRGEGARIAPDGRTLEATAFVQTATGEKLQLKAGDKLELEVVVAGVSLPVAVPRLVGDRRSSKAFPPGTAEAMRIPLDRREAFRSPKEAAAAGFEA